MRIHIASHLFAPRPQGAFCAELASHWASRGHEVVVFTGDPRPEEVVGGYEVVGGLPMAYGRSSLAHRLASRLAFGASAAAASAGRPRPDVFLSAGVLPLMTTAAVSVFERRGRPGGRARRIAWLFDLWPDVLAAHRPGSPLIQAVMGPLASGTNLALRQADDVVAISSHMAGVISSRLLGSQRKPPVHTIPLWATAGPDHAARSEALPGVAADTARAGRPLRAMYHGNLGLSYDFEPILAGASRFHRDEVTFVLVGDGAMRQSLARRIESDRLTNVELRPPLAEHEFTRSLATADVHLLPLRESWDGISFPSKLLPYLSVARPIVVLGPLNGESATLVREAGCGLTAPATAAGLESALRALAGDPARRATMATAGRALYLRRFSAARAFAAWDALIGDSAPGAGP